jgi:teichoic acid transport system permease protein
MSLTNLYFQTPWWVMIVFGVLIGRGIRDLKSTTTPLPMLAIMPAVFTIGGLYELVRVFPLDVPTVLLWLIAIAIGAVMGFLIERLRPTHVERRLITLAGSRTTLTVMIMFCVLNVGLSAALGVDPALVGITWFRFAGVGLSGAITGAFVGRFLCWWLAYQIRLNKQFAIS